MDFCHPGLPERTQVSRRRQEDFWFDVTSGHVDVVKPSRHRPKKPSSQKGKRVPVLSRAMFYDFKWTEVHCKQTHSKTSDTSWALHSSQKIIAEVWAQPGPNSRNLAARMLKYMSPWQSDSNNMYAHIRVQWNTHTCIYGPVLRLSTPHPPPPHGLGPQVAAPIPFYLQAIGSISEVQLRIC